MSGIPSPTRMARNSFLVLFMLWCRLFSGVSSQDGALELGTWMDPGCPVDGQSVLQMEARIKTSTVAGSIGGHTVQFVSVGGQSLNGSVVCHTGLTVCSPDSDRACHCQAERQGVLTVTLSINASLELNGRMLRMRLLDSNMTAVETSAVTAFPHVHEQIQVTLTYGNKSHSPAINNNIIYVPDDNQVIQLTVEGITHPSSITYTLSAPDVSKELSNQTSVNITVYDSTNFVTISYRETGTCQRIAIYDLTLKEVWRVEPVLTFGSITTPDNICLSHGHGLVTMEATVDFRGVDYSQWQLNALFASANPGPWYCIADLTRCSATQTTPCYCNEHDRDKYTVVHNATADVSLSQRPLNVLLFNRNSKVFQVDSDQNYPLVHYELWTSVYYSGGYQSPVINNSVISIPDDNQLLVFYVNGIAFPNRISYTLSSPVIDEEVFNQTQLEIRVYDNTNFITFSYEEDDFCQRSATYHFTLKEVSRVDPVLTFGPITSSDSCLYDGQGVVTVEATIDFSGVDYSQWAFFVFFYVSTGSTNWFCTADLSKCPGSATKTTPCYCKEHVRDKYTVVYKDKADRSLSQRPLRLELPHFRGTNWTSLQTDSPQTYPLVNIELWAILSYSSGSQSPVINNSIIYIHDDHQVIEFTASGISHPSSINYTLSSPGISKEVFNQSKVEIRVYDNTNFITISYEENDFCQRSATYRFTLKEVSKQEPSLTIYDVTSSDQCLLDGEGLISAEALVDFTGVDYSQWYFLVYFHTPSDPLTWFCIVQLTNCSESQAKPCYCKEHDRDKYTVVYSGPADVSVSQMPLHLTAAKLDINASTAVANTDRRFPLVHKHIQVTLIYGNESQSPAINNSVLHIPDDNQVIQFTVDGMEHPSFISYTLSSPYQSQRVDDVNNVNITVFDETNSITISYEERGVCRRTATYHFTLKEIWREEPVLSIGPLTTSSIDKCLVEGEDVVTVKATIDFSGVDYSRWIFVALFTVPEVPPLCATTLRNCSDLHELPCYCQEHTRDNYAVIYSGTAHASLSLQSISLQVVKKDVSTIETQQARKYPRVNEQIQVMLTYSNDESHSPAINNSVIYIPGDNQVIQVTVDGITYPSSVTYTLSAPDVREELLNQSSVNITVYNTTTSVTISYQETGMCQRTATYHLLLKATREEPELSLAAMAYRPDGCVIHHQEEVSTTAVANFTGVEFSKWERVVEFSSPSNQTICHASLDMCSPQPQSECYCNASRGDVYTLVFKHMARLSLSRAPIAFTAKRTNSSIPVANKTQMYPFVSENLKFSLSHKSMTQSPAINSTVLYITDSDHPVTFSIQGLTQPFTISYLVIPSMTSRTVLANQSTATIPVDTEARQVIVEYEETRFCRRTGVFHFPLEVNVKGVTPSGHRQLEGLSTGVIAGIVVAVVVVVALYLAIGLACNPKCCSRGKFAFGDSYSLG